MKIFTKHLLKEFLKPLFFIILIFTGLSIISDFFRELNLFLEKKAAASSVATYLLLTNVHRGIQLLPIAVLLASLFSMSSMAKAGEFTALKIAGINFKKAILPVFIGAFLLSIFVLFAVFYVVPPVVRKGYTVKQNEILKSEIKSQREVWKLSVVIPPGRRLHMGYVNLDKKIIRDAVLYEYDSEFRLSKNVIAKKVIWSDEEWTFYDGVKREYRNDEIVSEKRFSQLKMNIPRSPDDFILRPTYPEELDWAEHKRLIKKLNDLGVPARREKIQFLYRIASSFSNFVVIFIGVYFATTVSPRHGKLFGFTSALILAFLYYGLSALGQSLGENGTVSPVIAAWFGNIILGGIGAALFWKIPT